MDCSAPIIYQDENICILNPMNPESKTKGVRLVHVVGYMESIDYYEKGDLLKKVQAEGLKSSALLYKNKGYTALPKNHNNNTINVGTRQYFLEYDPNHFNRIFFRPPTSAPFELKNGKLVSAGPWRSFLGKEREDRLFFGGKSLAELAKISAEVSMPPEGIATIRVDPDKTFVFYEAMKDATGDKNKETGLNIPRVQRERETREQQFMRSRILLSQYLDQLEENLKGNPPVTKAYSFLPSQIVEGRWEALATIPNLPACAYEQITLSINSSLFSEETPADSKMKEFAIQFEKQKEVKGTELRKEIEQFLQPFISDFIKLKIRALDIEKQLVFPVNPRGKYKTEELKKEKLREIVTQLDLDLKAFLTKLQMSVKEFNPRLHPVQRNLAKNLTTPITLGLQEINSIMKNVNQYLKSTKGGKRQHQKTRKQTRKSRKI